MSENGLPDDAGAPEVEIRKGRRISAVWIIPMVAALIGGWLVYKTLSEQGPEITIAFETAEGLEPGKTQIKYKEVVVGTVATVSLDPVARTVSATAEMERMAESLLTDTARFWVVRPRLGIRDISGLGTLISGAYVELDPGSGGAPKVEFAALAEPPVIKADIPGTELVLSTTNLGSLTRGSPVYFKGIDVGEVLGYELVEDKSLIHVHIFVHAPHDALIRRTTRFWNVSGLNISMDANGMKVETGTLQSLVLGGVEFETPNLLAGGPPVAEGSEFVLFHRKDAIRETAHAERAHFVLFFQSSVRGLSIGAPVEFRGIRIGSVLDVRLEFDPDTSDFRIPVLIDIEPQRVSIFDRSLVGSNLSLEQRQANLDLIIERGLRARLKTGSFITGQLFVDLDLHPETPINLARLNAEYPEIPTIPPSLEEIANSVTDLLAKMQRLPLDTISEKILDTLEGADRLVNSREIKNALRSLSEVSTRLEKLVANADEKVVPEMAAALARMDSTLKKAENTLDSINSVVSPESELRYDTQSALQEISATARSVRRLAEFLERNPSALLTGKAPQ
jgi:paraquat-inducible protein B